VLDSLVKTIEDDLALCLHDGRGRLGRRTRRNHEEAEQALLAEFRRVAELISEGQTEQEVLQHLERRLQIEHVTSSTDFGNARRFLFEFFEFKPSAAALLCESLSTSHDFPEFRHFVDIPLAILASKRDDRAIGYAKTMLMGDDERLQASAAQALSWNRSGRMEMLPGETDVLAIMADHPNDNVRAAAGRAVFLIGMTDKALALDLLSKIRFSGVARIGAEALSGFARQGPLSWEDTNAELRKHILTQLIECPDLDDYELMSAISELSNIDPLRVTKFLMARIDRRTELQDFQYDALPYHWDPPLRIHETKHLARCLAEVRQWMTKKGQGRRYYSLRDDGAGVFKLVAGGWNDQAFVTLSDLGESSTEGDLVAVARIVGQAPIAVVLRQVELVTKLLRHADALGPETCKLVSQVLIPTNYGVFTMWSDQQPTKDVQQRDEARRLAGQLPRGSIESRFYNSLADSIDARLDLTHSRPEPRYDGRDW